MIKIIIRELAIYAGMLLALALLMHPDLLSDPSSRIGLLSERGSYLHPLVYAGVFYLLSGMIRLAIRFIRRIVKKTS
jgi:hypothetical protein